MTTLVTGATGLLGSHLTRILLERGERPRVLVRPGDSLSPLAEGEVDVCWGDMRDRVALEAAVKGVDRVLHCAARTGVWGPEDAYVSVNVIGLRAIVEAAVAAGVRRIVHVSSITVHGDDLNGSGDEEAPLRAESNPYSRSKLAGELILREMIRQHAVPVTIVRPGWIYGPGDVASFARFASLIEQGRMMVIGNGGNHVPLIYAGDAARGVLLASEVNVGVGRSYLLVNDEPVTQGGYLDAIAAELGVPPPRMRIPYRLAILLGTAAQSGARLAGSKKAPPLTRFGVQLLGGENRFVISRARSELGFSPQIGLAEGVARSVAWFRGATSEAIASGARA
jgi:2-alkyl-3-oxoalkanoate reductase